MERGEKPHPDSLNTPSGLTVTIGEIYSAYVQQRQKRVNVYAIAFFRTFQGKMLVATRPVGSTDRLLYMLDELSPPDTLCEPPTGTGQDAGRDIMDGVVAHAVESTELFLHVPQSQSDAFLPREGPTSPEKTPGIDVSSSLPVTNRAVVKPRCVDEIVECIEETRKKETTLVRQFLLNELRNMNSEIDSLSMNPMIVSERNRFYEWLCTETMKRVMPHVPVGNAFHNVNRQKLKDSLLTLYSQHNLQVQASIASIFDLGEEDQ